MERIQVQKQQDQFVLNTTVYVPGNQATTVYHHWGSAILEVYDLYGRMVLEHLVLQGDREVELDVSLWQRGMYVFRLSFRGDTVATEKVVVR